MKIKRWILTISGLLIVVSLFIGGYFYYNRGRLAPFPVKQKLYDGVTYRRVVQWIPRPMIAHVLTIDTKVKGIEFFITPADSKSETPLKARTTSQFLDEFDLQVAINGSGFSPWWSRGP